MPIARFELPDGRIGRFEVPDGTTPEQAMQLISSNLSSLIPKEEPAQQVEATAVPTAQQVEPQGNYNEMKPYEPSFVFGGFNISGADSL